MNAFTIKPENQIVFKSTLAQHGVSFSLQRCLLEIACDGDKY